MRKIIFYTILCLCMFGCKTVQQSAIIESPVSDSGDQKFEVLIDFKSEEGLKRLSYRLSHFKPEVLEEVSISSSIYLMSIMCKSYEIDGVIEKLNNEPEVDRAERYRP